MIYYSIRDIMNAAKKPMLVLQTDAHDNNAPFRTRWEANYEIVKNHKPARLENERFLLNPIVHNTSKEDLEKRIWIFPHMGDGSRIGAAAMKAFGIDSIVAEHNTEEAHEFARKHVVTDACLPLKGVVGDITAKISRLAKEGVEPNRHLAVLLPSAEGPCRFGQYRVVLRKFLDEEGFTNVPIISPLSVNDYADIPVGKERIMELTKLYYSGTYAFDILHDALLRTRPYESLNHISDATYNFCLDELVKAVGSGSITNIIKTMKENADKLELIDLKSIERKPKVLYAGEIYMRWHDEFTQDSVRKLEENGLEVMRQPLTEWISYINGAHVKRYLKQKQLLKLIKTGMKRGWMKAVSKKIRKPFIDLLETREFHNPMDFIKSIEENRLYHGDIEGESPLSIGLAYELMHNLDDISGFFHVGPWMCMQETTATAKINAMVNNTALDSVIPILHASFGDSPNLNLDAEIAVFREQCYARREQMKKKRKGKSKTGAIGYLSAGINRLSGGW
jgi:predicted nucleotide-binding protein (sugar kinase/HSP70/actin superfamily)